MFSLILAISLASDNPPPVSTGIERFGQAYIAITGLRGKTKSEVDRALGEDGELLRCAIRSFTYVYKQTGMEVTLFGNQVVKVKLAKN